MQQRSAGREASLQLAGRALALALNAVTLSLLLTNLGPAGFGHLAIAGAALAGLGVLTSAGIEPVLFRRLSRDPDDGVALGEALAVRSAVTFAVVGVYQLALVLARVGGPVGDALAVAGMVALMGPLQVPQQVLRSRLRLRVLAGTDVLGSAVFLAGLVVLGNDVTPAAALGAQGVGNAISWGLASALGIRLLRPKVSAAALAAWRRVLRESMPVGAGAALTFVYTRGQLLFLGATASARQVGLFGAAYRLVEIGIYVPMILVGAYFPAIARAHADRKAFGAALSTAFDNLLLLGVAAFAAGVVLAEEVLVVLGGPEYREAGTLLMIAAGALALMYPNGVLLQALLAAHLARHQLRAYAAASLCMLVVGVPLMLELEALGAAIASVVTELVVATAALMPLRRHTGWTPRRGPLLLAAGIAAVSLAIAAVGPLAIRLALAGLAAGFVGQRVLRDRRAGGAPGAG